MSHSSSRVKSFAAVLVFAVTAAVLHVGCTRALTTAVYLIKGTNEPAEFTGLKGKKVAVVCRPIVELQYSASNAHADLAEDVSRLLAGKIKKIQIVPTDEIAEWTDENSWDEYTEVGEAVEADLVVGIDIDHFSLYQGQTLYQGKAGLTVKVYDMKNGGQVLYEKRLPQLHYPPTTGLPTADRSEADFRREFVAEAAGRVGRLFYPYDSQSDYALDSRAGL